MSSNAGNIPDTLVLAFTTLYQPCSGNVGIQIQQGNTFSVPFDMTYVQGAGGVVYVKTTPETNFQAAAPLRLSPEGLSGKLAFMSIGSVQATVFGQQETVTRVFIIGTPDPGGYSWRAGIIVGSCTVTNGEAYEQVIAKLTQDSSRTAP